MLHNEIDSRQQQIKQIKPRLKEKLLAKPCKASVSCLK